MNPYAPKRTMPVGRLDYKSKQHPSLRWFYTTSYPMLEYGEEEFIYDIPVLVGPGAYLVFGDGFGGSSILLALGLKHRGLHGRVFAVDTYTFNKNHMQNVRASYERHGVADDISQFHGTTETVGTQFLHEGLEFKFILVDASHAYKDVKSDAQIAMPMVAPGGQIAFHDTNQEGVDQAMQETILADPTWEQTYWINRLKMFKRKP